MVFENRQADTSPIVTIVEFEYPVTFWSQSKAIKKSMVLKPADRSHLLFRQRRAPKNLKDQLSTIFNFDHNDLLLDLSPDCSLPADRSPPTDNSVPTDSSLCTGTSLPTDKNNSLLPSSLRGVS